MSYSRLIRYKVKGSFMGFSSKRILVRGLFALALLAGGGLSSVSAQTDHSPPVEGWQA